MSPYGGLIRYWSELLTGLTARGIPIRTVRPATRRAHIPEVSEADTSAARSWIFHSSYLSRPPYRVAATVVTVHDTIYEDDPVLAAKLDPTGDAPRLKRECVNNAQ